MEKSTQMTLRKTSLQQKQKMKLLKEVEAQGKSHIQQGNHLANILGKCLILNR